MARFQQMTAKDEKVSYFALIHPSLVSRCFQALQSHNKKKLGRNLGTRQVYRPTELKDFTGVSVATHIGRV